MSYQTCPICKGSGYQRLESMSAICECSVCNGRLIIHMVTGLPPCGPKNQSQDSLTHPFKTVEFPYGKKEEGSEASCSKEETEEKKEQA